jgi:hypothetical protein
MTRQLVTMDLVAGAAGAAGLTLLLKPSLAGRLLGLPDGEPARYGLRIAGAMLAALGLALAGFSTAFHLSL